MVTRAQEEWAIACAAVELVSLESSRVAAYAWTHAG
jgi:hypothetical protein